MVEAELARQHYAHDRTLARDFAISGVFDDIKGSTPEQAIGAAMVKIQMGRSMGIAAPDSMRYIYFTNGKPNVENELVAAKLQQAGFSWDPEFDFEEVKEAKTGRAWRKCVGCSLYLKRWNAQKRIYEPMLDRKGKQIVEAFTLADAEHALVWEKGKQIPLSEKFNYQSWPRDMYYWRSIARVKKFYAPHVLRGLRLKEEALDVITEDAPPEMRPEMPAPAIEAPLLEVPLGMSLRDRVMGAKFDAEQLPIEEEPEQ
jgi:hypothetical protein